MTPTARSLKLLRERGYLVEKVEQRLPIPKKFVTRDLFGCIDLVAVQAGRRVRVRDRDGFRELVSLDGGEILGVQVTSMSNLAAREAKARALPELEKWLEAGGHFILHGWAKKGPRGARKTWQLVEREVLREVLPWKH